MFDSLRLRRVGLAAAAAALAVSSFHAQSKGKFPFDELVEGGATAQVIGFRGLPAGTILEEVFSDLGQGPIGVFGLNPAQGAVNTAVVFDSANPTGQDEDLGTPNEDFGGPGKGSAGEVGSPFANDKPLGNLLIISEDLTDSDGDMLVDDPDDTDRLDSTLLFDFLDLAPVRIGGVTVIDVEPDEPFATVEFFGEAGRLLATFNLPEPGDNGVVAVGMDQSGVHQMVIRLNGSGAIDNILYLPENDCNDNGVSDLEDIEQGTSEDCNQNGIPDECEPDCDGDGVPDDCEVDCDANGTPDDCEVFTDCNENDIPDSCDIDAGTSYDVNRNGIPDECEPDCNQNGIPDAFDIEQGTSEDCNQDGIPDECEPDCDGDGVPDDCEVDCDANGTPDDCEVFTDCNENDIPDSCDIDAGTSDDVNRNGIPDECEQDCNSNGIPDAVDIEEGTSLDCNLNGIPDECEPDCDGDGVPDDCEADCDANGTPDDCETFTDCNSNGLPDSCDIDSGKSLDCNLNGIPDECEPDCDGDGVPDDCEVDCDANGTPDDCEVFTDCNENDIPDSCDIDAGTSKDVDGNGVPDECQLDCNGNGIPDAFDIKEGTSEDCNLNGVPDECEPDCDGDGVPDDCEADCDANGTPDECETFTDCNGNDIPDSCDIDAGTSTDTNGNGIPDECEDCDGDGIRDDLEPDCDGDGIPDDCEPDCDMDGTPDECEPDCDQDGTPDDCENDCNGNGVPDDCEACADSVVVLWDLDHCMAFGHAAFFDEFIGTPLGGCSNVDLEPGILEQKNGIHSCTNDALTGEPGDAMCVAADPDLEFDLDDPQHVVRLEIDVTETEGQVASLESFRFWQLAGWSYVVTDEFGYYFEATNNPPAFFGLRVLRNGVEVFFQEDLPTPKTWSESVFSFAGDGNFEVTNETVKFTFELAAYAPIPNGGLSSIWDLDELSVTICCAAGGAPGDCDGDGVADFCETDTDGDGIPDDCEAGSLNPTFQGEGRSEF